MDKNIYSVGQVNQYIKNMFAQDFLLHRLRIKGEVSNCKYHSSGHIYFTLKDPAGTIGAVMFASHRAGLAFQMKEGDKVVVTGSVEVYEKTGVYQIYAQKIELDGAGNLFIQFLALKRELEEMGMFAEEYKQPIPRFAQRVGVVTAPTGAAVQDIRSVAARRNPYVQLILYPALVQGEGAADSIVEGIHALEQIGVDVIIVGRGGGSIEDLWAFNEERVARAIFDCRVPIVSAVGHQTDWTIADYAADLRAPTPTAAAQLCVYDYAQTAADLAGLRAQMEEEIRRRLELAHKTFEHHRMRMRYLSPRNRLNEKRRAAMEYEERLEGRMQAHLTACRHRLELLAGAMESHSPVRKIAAGYAYVSAGGHTLRSAAQVKPGDALTIELLDGCIRARTETVEERRLSGADSSAEKRLKEGRT